MKKILFCLTLALVGCKRPMTIEEVAEAVKYCDSKGMTAQVLTSTLDPGYPRQVRCWDKEDKLYYDIPRK